VRSPGREEDGGAGLAEADAAVAAARVQAQDRLAVAAQLRTHAAHRAPCEAHGDEPPRARIEGVDGDAAVTVLPCDVHLAAGEGDVRRPDVVEQRHVGGRRRGDEQEDGKHRNERAGHAGPPTRRRLRRTPRRARR
jgi:hypothetical protein